MMVYVFVLDNTGNSINRRGEEMNMAKMTMDEIGFSLSDDEEKEINAAEKLPVVDDDSPEMTKEMLKQFKRMNRTKLTDIK